MGLPPLNSRPYNYRLSLDQRTLSWLVISLAILPIHSQLSFQETSNKWPMVATLDTIVDANKYLLTNTEVDIFSQLLD